MSVTVAVVVVPNRADVAGVSFEEELRYGEDAGCLCAADRTGRGSGRFRHRPLPLVDRPAAGAGVVVFGH